jgi:TolB-like protein/Tfp pilus assembly protein PilF
MTQPNGSELDAVVRCHSKCSAVDASGSGKGLKTGGRTVAPGQKPSVCCESVENGDVRAEGVRRELELVLTSPGFSRNERLSHFLRFLVERHLEGRNSELKESVIAVEVFGRAPGYDPKLDNIVRTEAMRLRARLDKYYATEGSRDSLIIELPKGAYKPVFRDRPAVPPVRRSRSGWTSWVVGGLTAAALVVGATWWWTRPARLSVTVAVLPFENQDHNSATDYFADGLTDEIIRHLSIIDGLTVPSRTSSFALKGKGLNAAEAAQQLGADYLVEGSVQHAGDQLRVTVALVRTGDEARLWSERFDRKLTDVFAIQDEISRGIVNNLRLKLNPGGRRYETNLEAYDLYLRGRHIMASFPTRGRPIAKPAIDYFEQSIAKDPNYAIADAGMADAFLAIERNVGTAAPLGVIAFPRAKAAAERAVELDPLLSEAQSAMASIHAREYAWQEAERGFRRAIELNPNNALAHLELGATVLVVRGRFEEGLEAVRRAVALDPFSPYANTEVGAAFLLAGRYGEAIDLLQKAITLDPSRNRPYTLMARALYLQGKSAEALTIFQDIISPRMGSGRPNWLACAEVRAGRRDRALTLLQEHLKSRLGSRRLAETYACLGDAEHSMEHLEKALTEHEAGLAELVQAPELAWLRTNARFAALRQKLQLAP